MLTVLIGAPGCGATTVGRALAARLGVDFIDTDELVVAAAGKPRQDIFVDDGPAAYRALEAAAVSKAVAGGGVVAVGSGAILSEDVRALLREVPVAWLHVEVAVAARRVGLIGGGPIADARALLIEQLRERTPLYAEVADVGVRTSDRTVDEVVDVVAGWVAEGSPSAG